MMEEKKYLYKFDDPYAILAYHIVGTYRPADVLRCLTDNQYLKTLIIKEVRLQDMGGHFVDCIIEDILEKKKRMEWMHTLDTVGQYLYECLDKRRLREEIILVLKDLGVEIDYTRYSSGKAMTSSSGAPS